VIAHVAEAGEGRGRVVLRYCVGHASPAAIAAAVRIAQAFQSEIESLFIEDTQLLELAQHSFLREMSFGGRVQRTVTREHLETSFRASFIAARRRIEAEARAADVPLRERIVRDEPLHALASACAQNGPWNVIALAEAFGSDASNSIRMLFDEVRDATGLVLAGPAAVRTVGPIVVAAEELDRLPGMMRLAERIGRVSGSEVKLALFADAREQLEQFEGEARLLLGDRSDIQIACATVVHGEPAAAAEVVRRLCGGFVIARFGGVVVPAEGRWRSLVSALECPLFLVR
jgi:hypothetical protein